METSPDKCFRCGAPVNSKASIETTCEYCGSLISIDKQGSFNFKIIYTIDNFKQSSIYIISFLNKQIREIKKGSYIKGIFLVTTIFFILPKSYSYLNALYKKASINKAILITNKLTLNTFSNKNIYIGNLNNVCNKAQLYKSKGDSSKASLAIHDYINNQYSYYYYKDPEGSRILNYLQKFAWEEKSYKESFGKRGIWVNDIFAFNIKGNIINHCPDSFTKNGYNKLYDLSRSIIKSVDSLSKSEFTNMVPK